jgi:hypothetical protein
MSSLLSLSENPPDGNPGFVVDGCAAEKNILLFDRSRLISSLPQISTRPSDGLSDDLRNVSLYLIHAAYAFTTHLEESPDHTCS